MDHMDMFSNKSIRYVLAIVKYGGVSKAAEKLCITQPALSHYIQKLEASLGVPLFWKTGKKLNLTYAGECFVDYAHNIVHLEDELMNNLINIKSSERGRIRFALPILRSNSILPDLIPQFKRIYPKVDLELIETHSRPLKEMLDQEDIDCFLLTVSSDDTNWKKKVTGSSLKAEVVNKERILFVTSQEHASSLMFHPSPINGYPEIEVSDLGKEKLVMLHNDQLFRIIISQILEQQNIEPEILLTTRSVEAALSLVSQGFGSCFISENIFKSSPICSHLSSFLINDSLTRINQVLAYRIRDYQPKYLLDFIEIIKGLFQKSE